MFWKSNFRLLVFVVLLETLSAFDIELTVLIPSNQRECFHQVLDTGKTVEIEYEVLNGGDFDINYWLYSPSNRVLQSDFKKRDGHQTLKLEESGEYRFCFDNAFSRFNQKQVYFSLRLMNEQGNSHPQPATDSWMKDMARDDLGDLQSKVQQFKVSFKQTTTWQIRFTRPERWYANRKNRSRCIVFYSQRFIPA